MTIEWIELNDALAFTALSAPIGALVEDLEIQVCSRVEEETSSRIRFNTNPENPSQFFIEAGVSSFIGSEGRNVLETLAATHVADNNAHFYWNVNIRNLPLAWYDVKLIHKGCECGEVMMRIQTCSDTRIVEQADFTQGCEELCVETPKRTVSDCPKPCPPEPCDNNSNIVCIGEDIRPHRYNPNNGD